MKKETLKSIGKWLIAHKKNLFEYSIVIFFAFVLIKQLGFVYGSIGTIVIAAMYMSYFNKGDKK